MIIQEYGKFILVCDVCSERCDVEFDSFEEAAKAKKNMGWKSKKIDYEWQDICPECI